MKTFRLTKLLCVFPVLAVTLIAGTAISVPFTVDRFAPFSSTTSECLICGQMRTVEQRWMQSPRTSIYSGEDSKWMQTQIDSKHNHWWVACSTEERPSWFGYSMIGCGGGVGGVSSLNHLRKSKGAKIAQPYIEKYMQLTSNGDLKLVREYVQHEVLPAFQDRAVAGPVSD